MKFIISSSLLSAHLMTIGRVIVQKNSLPILDCFCFDIKGQTLTVTASDNDTTLRAELELNECDGDMRFAVNAKTLQDAIKEIPEQPLSFDLNTDTLELTINYQNGQYKLMAQDAEEYPMPVVDTANRSEFAIPASLVLSGVSRGLVAAATGNVRPQLSTVCFDVQDGKLSMVACNGLHLALTTVDAPTAKSNGSYLLNVRPAGLLRNVLAKAENDVKLSFGDRDATFTVDEYTMTSRLVEGKYPNYRIIIPKDNANCLTINREALISTLRRALVFANPSVTMVKFRIEQSTLLVSSQDTDFGKSAEETMLCDYQGTPMRIAFKGSTLLELLQHLESEDVTLKIADPTRPALIVPAEEKEDEKVLMLIVPSFFNE